MNLYSLAWVKYDISVTEDEVFNELHLLDKSWDLEKFNNLREKKYYAHWTGDVETIQELSSKFIGVIFILEKQDVENAYNSARFYFKNGIVQESKVKRIIYEAYDPEYFKRMEEEREDAES